MFTWFYYKKLLHALPHVKKLLEQKYLHKGTF